MAMSVQKTLNPQFNVSSKVSYNETESKPDQNYFFFTYKISITNKGNQPAQLMSRHWKIQDANGGVEEVRGAGVIGLQPKINPGQTFEYESVCPISTSSGSMRGTYQFMNDDGSPFEVEIPEFYLIAPLAIH